MSRSMTPVKTPPDSLGQTLLLETPQELEVYLEKFIPYLVKKIEEEENTQEELDFYENYVLKKKHLKTLYDSPEPSSLEMVEVSDYRLWVKDLCKEEYEFWSMTDRRVPVVVQQILGLWYDYYGGVNFDRKCKFSRGGKPTGSMDYYLVCSHTKPITYVNDYTSAKNFFKHIHFIYNYFERKAYYITKDYRFLFSPYENQDTRKEKIIEAYKSFKKPTKPLYRLSEDFRIQKDSVLNRQTIEIDLSRDPVEIVEEMYDSLNCTKDETQFIPTDRKMVLNDSVKFSSKFRVPKGTPPHVIRSLKIDSSNPSL